MLTPRFSIKQDDKSITITLHAPYCDLESLETDIDGTTFMFFAKPYFLRLTLPGEIVDNENRRSTFDVDTQEFTYNIDKVTEGQFFDDLDMITKLLSRVRKKTSIEKPEIEVLNEKIDALDIKDGVDDGLKEVNAGIGSLNFNEQADSDDVDSGDIDSDDIDSDDGEKWCIEQEVDIKVTLTGCNYGFANQRIGYLDSCMFELSDILDDTIVPNVNNKSRVALMDRFVKSKFDPSHYVHDLYDTEIDELATFASPWVKLTSETIEFTKEQIDFLKDLPNREYILSERDLKAVYIGAIDILFAYCYDMRCWSFESNVESPWTYNRVSPMLSAFIYHKNLRVALIKCYRRAVTFPLYRNIQLCNAALSDVETILDFGKKKIVQAMIDVYKGFESTAGCQPRYILNELYMKDYIIFVQKCDWEQFKKLRNEIHKIRTDNPITSEELDLDLAKVEAEFMAELLDSSSETDSDD